DISTDGVYYWRVRAKNAAGEFGAWSTAGAFTLDTTAPAAPVLAQPLDAATPVGIPTFTWAASVGANAYQFEIDDNNDFLSTLYTSPDGSIDHPGTPLAVLGYKPTGLTYGTPYYWRVRARDAAGNWSGWSAYRTVTVQASLPTAPVLVSPALNTLTNVTTPTFTWKAVLTANKYQIQVDDLSTFASPALDVSDILGTATTYTPTSPITPDAKYYWRMRALNSTGGLGPWSSVSYFTLDSTAPAVPTLLAPSNGASLSTLPTLSWSAVTGATAYQIQVDNDSNFESPLYTSPDGSTDHPGTPLTVVSYKLANIPLVATYYWHVRARDAAGNWSAYSAYYTFVIDLDSDGDKLPDAWEIYGYDADGDGIIDVNLPALGANPKHKDIFIEMDYMVKPGVGDLGPDATVINNIVAVFNAAPVTNPDGTTGIHIHLEKDDQVPYDADLNPVWTDFDAIKSSYFDPKRTATHHYMIWADGYGGDTSSGISRGINASDFIVSLGKWNNGAGGTNYEKLGTFIHELGHNLNLTHGGSDHENYKPNYLSVMNYAYQTWGLLRNGHWGDEGYPLNFDYQRINVVNLNEKNLNETTGLYGADDVSNYGVLYVYAGDLYYSNSSKNIDWNCNSNLETSVKADINGSGTYGTLVSQNNWQNISFNGGGVIGSGLSLSELQELIQANPPLIKELTWDEMKTLKRVNPTNK
ncbi:hypothetical protein, partial [Leptolinea tardivitalis]|uniref:hypothetical protein n=1 Tax=Leptolinea tardivitalis TaxID=229920 RepID=UPI0007863FB4